MDYRNISYWFDSLGEVPLPEPEPLPKRTDVAIAGAGLTGLWTAYYLKTLAPELDVTLLEAEVAGFGASGRNGGWCMGSISGMEELLEDEETREAAAALQQVLWQVPDEVQRVCLAEDIDCDYQKGGWLNLARSPEAARDQADWADFLAGIGLEKGAVFLDREAAAKRIAASSHGALFDPNSAAIHPGRLVQGLARANRRLGVRILEQTRVLDFAPGEVTTHRGRLRAGNILRTTEGYTDSIRGSSRRLLPLYSMVIATEPLAPGLWEQLGLHDRETFGDSRLLEVYGQRTGDGRLVFGGEGSYFWGSAIRQGFAESHPAFARLTEELCRFFPALRGQKITHRWGGLMGVSRDWQPHVFFDPVKRMGSAGGYVGEGVGASNLAGCTLAHLVLGSDDHITRLLWVRREPRSWVREPWRWLGSRAAKWLAGRADRAELQGRYNSLARRLFHRLTG